MHVSKIRIFLRVSNREVLLQINESIKHSYSFKTQKTLDHIGQAWHPWEHFHHFCYRFVCYQDLSEFISVVSIGHLGYDTVLWQLNTNCMLGPHPSRNSCLWNGAQHCSPTSPHKVTIYNSAHMESLLGNNVNPEEDWICFNIWYLNITKLSFHYEKQYCLPCKTSSIL